LDGSDIIYSLEDLKLGAKGDLIELIPGRRVQLTLGGQGDSTFCYRAVLLDAGPQSAPFLYNCGIFLVPKVRFLFWSLFCNISLQIDNSLQMINIGNSNKCLYLDVKIVVFRNKNLIDDSW